METSFFLGVDVLMFYSAWDDPKRPTGPPKNRAWARTEPQARRFFFFLRFSDAADLPFRRWRRRSAAQKPFAFRPRRKKKEKGKEEKEGGE